jgi:hypothetical protein
LAADKQIPVGANSYNPPDFSPLLAGGNDADHSGESLAGMHEMRQRLSPFRSHHDGRHAGRLLFARANHLADQSPFSRRRAFPKTRRKTARVERMGPEKLLGSHTPTCVDFENDGQERRPPGPQTVGSIIVKLRLSARSVAGLRTGEKMARKWQLSHRPVPGQF